MDKKQILSSLELSGEVNLKGKGANWKQAFDSYMAETKDYSVSMECGSCYAKVLKWLRS